jgi:MFS family permease
MRFNSAGFARLSPSEDLPRERRPVERSAVRLPRNSMLMPVYVPTAMLAFGQGLLVPTLPVYAATFDVSYGLISLAVGAAAIGTLVMDVPAGMLLGRIGRKPAMILGTAIVALSTLLIATATIFPALVIYRFIGGIGTALWGISRHAYITDVTPAAERGRSIAVFGGINRIGVFAGPFLGGVIAAVFGLRVPFVVASLMSLAALVVSLIYVRETGATTPTARSYRWGLVVGLMKSHGADLGAAGIAQTFAQMIRAGRQLIIPLYADSQLGLGVAAIGTIVSAGAVIDMLLFIPAGMIMDRFGRKWAAVPSFTIMALGMALIPLTSDFWTLLGAAVVIGFGNGLGSGTMMTLGADLAPPGATGEFLGVWRLIGDTGAASGPLVVGAVADVVGLDMTALILGGAGLASAGILAVLVRETRREPAPASD